MSGVLQEISSIVVIWAVVKFRVPFLGTLNSRCRLILGTPKGTIILTTTHIIRLQHKPKGLLKLFLRLWEQDLAVPVGRQSYRRGRGSNHVGGSEYVTIITTKIVNCHK